jgi:hypothetical protein
MRLIRSLLVEDGAVLVRAAGNILWEAEPDLLLNVVVNDQHCLAHLQNNTVELVIVNPATVEMPLSALVQEIHKLSPAARVLFVHTWSLNPANNETQRMQAYRGVARFLAESRAANRPVGESFARFSFSSAGILILSDLVFADLTEALVQLLGDANAAAVYLTDSNARILSRAETSLKIAPEEINTALEKSLARIYETGQLPGHGLESMHLAYRGIQKKNLYLFKVSGQLLLFLLVDSGGSESYFEAVWNTSFQTVAQLRHLLSGGFGKTAPFAGVDERLKQASPGQSVSPNQPASSAAPASTANDKPGQDKPAYKVLI